MGYYLSLVDRLLFNIMIVLLLGGDEEFVASLVVLYHDVYNLAILYLLFSFTFIMPLICRHIIFSLSFI